MKELTHLDPQAKIEHGPVLVLWPQEARLELAAQQMQGLVDAALELQGGGEGVELRHGPLGARVLGRVDEAEEVVDDAAADDVAGGRVEVGLAVAAVSAVEGPDQVRPVQLQVVGARTDDGPVAGVRPQVDEVDVSAQRVVETPEVGPLCSRGREERERGRR